MTSSILSAYTMRVVQGGRPRL